MFPSKRIRIASVTLSAIALVAGLMALVWNIIYYNHRWNHILLCEYRVDGVIGMLSVSLSCLIVFGGAFLLLRKRLTNRIKRILYYVAFGLYNCAALATIVLVAYDSIKFLGPNYTDIRLDNQLASDDADKFHEAVDSVIARTENHMLYDEPSPNEYMMKAAREGYAPAQNYIGVYFHEQAKKWNDRIYGHRVLDDASTPECQEYLNRATYWWMKGAKQNHGRSQENLGRMKGKLLLSNQPYNYEEAKYWLTRAAKNGSESAYYYLGLLCRDHSVTEAVRYWEIGAKKENEDCMRMLENPDYIYIEKL